MTGNFMLSYGSLSPERDEDVVGLLQQFIVDEPALSVLRLNPQELWPALQQWTQALLKCRDHCFAAVDEKAGVLAGVSLNFSLFANEQGVEEDTSGWLGYYYPHEGVCMHEKFIRDMEHRSLLFEKFDVAKIFQVEVLLCRRDYRGSGIGKALVDKSIQEAKRKGYTIVCATTSSVHSQRIFEMCGFQKELQISYEDHPYTSLFTKEEKMQHKAYIVYSLKI